MRCCKKPFFLLLLVLLLFFSAFLAADGILPSGFSENDLELLNRGIPVIRRLDSIRNVQTAGKSSNQRELIQHFSDLRPNFLAEAIFLLPVPEGQEEAILNEVTALLQNFGGYEEIPYYSQRNRAWFQLFYDVELLNFRQQTAEISKAELSMQLLPFDPGVMTFSFEHDGEHLSFQNWNRDPLYYRSVKAVKEERMQTGLVVENHPGALVFYGLGGAKAFTFFGLFGKRLETAFLGRVEAFFSWLYEEMGQVEMVTFDNGRSSG